MKTILLVEDDKSLNRGISFKLHNEGYSVFSAFSVGEAKNFYRNENIDLIISDITLPDGDGLNFGQWVRSKSDVYLIYLTALDSEIDIVNGYDMGADDYITKPFSVNILTSKVNALMRRLEEKESGESNSESLAYKILTSEGIEVNMYDMSVTANGKSINLSKTELMLLIYLMENSENIISKEKILDRVWGIDGQFVDDNTVTVNISRLKSKLSTGCISNVRGLGYIWTGKVARR